MLHKMRYYLALASLLLLVSSGKAQSVYFHFTDGTQRNYLLYEVEQFNFQGDVLNLVLEDGTTYSWNPSTIEHYRFDVLTGMDNHAQAATLMPLRIYPNPMAEELTIEYSLDSETAVVLQVCDMQGRTVWDAELGKQQPGQHTVYWNGRDNGGGSTAAGTYLCRIVTQKFQMSNILIIQ